MLRATNRPHLARIARTMLPTRFPTLVLLPGMDGTGRLFEPLLKTLGPDVPVQVLDYPANLPLDYPALQERVWEQLPKDRPFVLLGESFSGPVAVALAARKPPGLLGLVLCASFVHNPRPALSPLMGLLKLVSLHHLPSWPMAALLLGRFSTPGLRTALAGAIAQVASSVLRARLLAVRDVDCSAALAASQLPLMYLRARQDRLVPATAAALVLQLRPDTQVIEIDGPHCLLQAAPAEAAQHLRHFIRALPGLQYQEPALVHR